MYVPDGEPTCRKAVSGFDSVNWKARSRVVLDELVLLDLVGLMNLNVDGDVVSRVIEMLYRLELVAWLPAVSFANIVKLCWPFGKLSKDRRPVFPDVLDVLFS